MLLLMSVTLFVDHVSYEYVYKPRRMLCDVQNSKVMGSGYAVYAGTIQRDCTVPAL